MSKIAHSLEPVSRLRKSGVMAKLWPNGEIAFHLPKKLKEAPLVKGANLPTNHSIWRWWVLAYGVGEAVKAALSLGLSNVPNFDKPNAKPRYGLRGITSLGRRRVRNAAYMLTREVGKHRLTFSTVTVPAFHDEDMSVIHLNWHKIVDRYRLLLSRQLVKGGLTGEVVGVSEIQEQRYEHNGFPVLHCHFVFAGANRAGSWIVTPKRHDYIWRKSIQSVLYGPLPEFKSACQLQSVKKDAAGYLGKYMSKGASSIAAVVADGFEWALPRQWWSCSRSLVARMRTQMRYFNEGTSWLISEASRPDSQVFSFYSVVKVTMPDGQIIDVGSYGKLSPSANGKIRGLLSLG